MTDKTQYLIVGAGISGLAFADHLESDNYIVCEADSEIGGYCKTIKQDGFTWDYSGHFFHFKDESIERYLRERMEDAEIVKPRKVSKIFWSGEWIDFPFQNRPTSPLRFTAWFVGFPRTKNASIIHDRHRA